jgi:hypothetical protein
MNGSDVEYQPDGSVTSSSAAGPGLPLTRRRLALLVGGLFALWLVGVFARQVGEASSAANQADLMRARNVAMEQDVAALEQEIRLIKQPAFVSQMARGYLLGTPREIPFVVDPNAPPVATDAPGSIGIKGDTAGKSNSPLDAWLQVLFGQN